MGRASEVPTRDYVAIVDLYARYNLASDTGDPEEYARCFAPDGLLCVRGLAIVDGKLVRGTGEIRIQGRRDLAVFKRKDQAGRGGRYRRHWNGSIALEALGDGRVRGLAYLQAFDGQPGAVPTLAQTGVYEDFLVRIDGEWTFATRTLTID
jgi:hypothetical protein